tara:strand:- start:606 stop:2348 length:1743 start_codon:yes stop_codon:yes gene_type:complete
MKLKSIQPSNKKGYSTLEIRQATAWRSKTILIAFLVAFSVVVCRAFYLQFLDVEQWQKKAEKKYTKYAEMPAIRGKIFDRNGEILASSVLNFKVGIVPSRFNHRDNELKAFSKLVGQDPVNLFNRIQTSKKYFRLRSSFDRNTVEEIKLLKLEGVEFEKFYERDYPFKRAFSTLIGLTSVDDDRGIEGIEKSFDHYLRGSPGQKKLLVESGNVAFDEEVVRVPEHGQDVQLTVDAGIQSIVYKEALAAKKRYEAKSISVVLLDARTGDILSIVNVPAADPTNRRDLNLDEVRNRAITDQYEPGSTLKPFAIATALEEGVITSSSVIQTAPGFIEINGKKLQDERSFGKLTVKDVLAKSSNVGTVKVALKVPSNSMYHYLNLLGFGKSPDLPLLGIRTGTLPKWKTWEDINQATISYGYGVDVTLIQLARAYTVFTQNGYMLPVKISSLDREGQKTPIFSEYVVTEMQKMLVEASGKFGTGKAARVSGYSVAGKTGTTRKIENGKYSTEKYIASYVGFAPSSSPRFIAAIRVDEPKTSKTGGKVAAPLFSKIAASALRDFQMSPDPNDQIFPKTANVTIKR